MLPPSSAPSGRPACPSMYCRAAALTAGVLPGHSVMGLACCSAVLQQLQECICCPVGCWSPQLFPHQRPRWHTVGQFVASRVLRLVCACRPQATSNTLWAYAKLAYWPPQSLLAAAGAQMVADLTKSVPQVLDWLLCTPHSAASHVSAGCCMRCSKVQLCARPHASAAPVIGLTTAENAKL